MPQVHRRDTSSQTNIYAGSKSIRTKPKEGKAASSLNKAPEAKGKLNSLTDSNLPTIKAKRKEPVQPFNKAQEEGRIEPSQSSNKADNNVDACFKELLKSIANIDIARLSRPTDHSCSFVVYAHENKDAGQAYSKYVEEIIEWLKAIRAPSISDRTPLLLWESANDANPAVGDILSSQMRLLPTYEGSDKVEKVILCVSPVLRRYCENPFAASYIAQIQELYETQKHNLPKFETETREFVETQLKEDGFHHILTEIAFLMIRRLHHRHGNDGVITITLDGDDLGIDCLAGLSVYLKHYPSPRKGQLHVLFFKLLRRLSPSRHRYFDHCYKCYERLRQWCEDDREDMSLHVKVENEIQQLLDDLRKLSESGVRDGEWKAYAQIIERQLSAEHLVIMQKLNAPDMIIEIDKLEDRKDKLFKDSYVWILANKEYQDFVDWSHGNMKRLLWIKGDPGKGKTMLLLGIVRELKYHVESHPDNGYLSYFFCQGTNGRLNTATSVLRGLIWMLLLQQKSLVRHMDPLQIDKLHEDDNAFYILKTLLVNMLGDETLVRAYLVIDALDECRSTLKPGLNELLGLISDISASNDKVKWLVSSRHIPEIGDKLEIDATRKILSLELNNDSVAAAVAAYIDHKMKYFGKSFQKLYSNRTEPSFRDKVQKIQESAAEAIRQKAAGNFLWVALVFQQIQGCSALKLLKHIEEMPSDLNGMYAQMMHDINNKEDPGKYQMVLMVAANAYCPLTLSELVMLAQLDELDLNDRIVRECGLLNLSEKEQKVYFVHQSAKDYLTSPPGYDSSHPKILLDTVPRGILETFHLPTDLKVAATDSGYDSMTKTQHGISVNDLHESETALGVSPEDDTATISSNDSFGTMQPENSIGYFAQQLFTDLGFEKLDPDLHEKLFNDLDEILADFSFRLRQGGASLAIGTAGKFIRKHRKALSTSFKHHATLCRQDETTPGDEEDRSENQESTEDGGEENDKLQDTVMSPWEKIEMWKARTSDMEAQDSEAHSENQRESSGEVLTESNAFEKFKNSVLSTSAYEWLLATLRNRLVLENTEGNILQHVKNTVLGSLPKPSKAEWQVGVLEIHAKFEVEWSLRAFVADQWPSCPPSDGISSAVTLTGSLCGAQALTCSAYLDQVWPTTGRCLLGLINDVLRTGAEQTCTRADYLQLTAFDYGSCFSIQVRGTGTAIAEVGQQLCWLTAALRSSSLKRGIVKCTPRIQSTNFLATSDRAPAAHDTSVSNFHPARRPIAEMPASQPILFNINMDMIPLNIDGDDRGTCWRHLFGSAVIVGGFPILRRPQPDLGLEIPLDLVAGLLGTRYICRFDNTVFVKGYSAMITLSDQVHDLLVWHLSFKESGSYISYFDCAFQPAKVSMAFMTRKRHIVGWCPTARNHVGVADAGYNITLTREEKVDADCALYRCQLLPPDQILYGKANQISKDHQSIHFESEKLPKIMRRMGSRFVCFWDTKDQRGWLVDGIAALLHLLRASLKCDRQQTRFLYQLKPGDLEEPSEPYHFDAPEAFLSNPHNQNAVILKFSHKGVERTETLEDRMVHYYHVLDQAFNYQERHQDILRHKPRGLLEGWEFYHLVWRRDDAHEAHRTTLASIGKGWVDLLRSTNAVTLFGTGFGDLIKPSADSTSLCPTWRTLPTKLHYMAASVSVLEKVMDNCGGNPQMYPKQLTESILWLTPASPFDCCGCKNDTPSSQLVQVAWPKKFVPEPIATAETLDLTCHSGGAVVFGHNEAYDWHWGDDGPPLEGLPPVTNVERSSDFEGNTAASDTSGGTGVKSTMTILSQKTSLTTQLTSSVSADQSQQSYGQIKACDQARLINGNVYYNFNFNAAGNGVNTSCSNVQTLPESQSHP